MTTADLNDQVDSLNFAVEESMRYHQRRRGFYERTHNFIMFLIVVCGSTAFSELAVITVPMVTVLATFDLVWKPSHRSRDHEILFRRFSDLAIAIRTTDSSKESYLKWIRDRLLIEADEPPVYYALEADCDNEVRHAWGRDKDVVHIGPWYRLTMNLLRHAETEFKTVASAS